MSTYTIEPVPGGCALLYGGVVRAKIYTGAEAADIRDRLNRHDDLVALLRRSREALAVYAQPSALLLVDIDLALRDLP